MKNSRCKSGFKMGEKNPMWKGKSVSYSKLHEWVRTRMPKTNCVKCGSNKNLDLANKGIYNRDLNNWEWLCRRCHMESDGRLRAFLKHRKPTPVGNKLYKLVKNRPKREKHPRSKLTETQVEEIRNIYMSQKKTLKVLAGEFGVSFQLISLIVNKKIWK